MKIPKPPAPLVELFDDLLADLGGDRRMMFGCPCAFTNGQMFSGLYGSSLFVRLSESARQELLAIEGARIFDPMGGRPMREYVVLPDDLLEDDEAVRGWMERAHAHARSLPPKAARKAARNASARQVATTAPRSDGSGATARQIDATAHKKRF